MGTRTLKITINDGTSSEAGSGTLNTDRHCECLSVSIGDVEWSGLWVMVLMEEEKGG